MIVKQLKSVEQFVKWKVKSKRAKPYGGKRQALTQDELDRLFAALKGNRHGHRDYVRSAFRSFSCRHDRVAQR
jgi:hypothetical protein